MRNSLLGQAKDMFENIKNAVVPDTKDNDGGKAASPAHSGGQTHGHSQDTSNFMAAIQQQLSSLKQEGNNEFNLPDDMLKAVMGNSPSNKKDSQQLSANANHHTSSNVNHTQENSEEQLNIASGIISEAEQQATPQERAQLEGLADELETKR